MATISSQEAIARARAAMSIDSAQAARAWLVQRLDRPRQAYYLVVFGGEDASIAAAAVDATQGVVETEAHLSGDRAQLSIDSARAVALTDAGENAQAELVWQPCKASRSPLYPLWQIRVASRYAYVDQQGIVWDELEMPGPGGHAG